MKTKVKTLSFTAKCSDRFGATLYDEAGKIVHEHDGYVPGELGIGSGDYVELDIDLKTGQILNWKPIFEIDVPSILDEED